MTLQELIDLKVGDPLTYKNKPYTVKWTEFYQEKVGERIVDKKVVDLFSKNFGMCFTDGQTFLTIRSTFPDPKALELPEFMLHE